MLIFFIILQWKNYLSAKNCYDLLSLNNKIILATEGGVLSFDKLEENFIQITNADGLLSNNVVKVVKKDDNLWFLCSGGGISIFTADLINVDEFYRDNFRSTNFSSICVDNDSVWVGTYDNEPAWLYDGKNITYINIKPSNEINDIKIIDNKIWFATNSGIGILDKNVGNFIIYNKDSGLVNDTTFTMIKYKDKIFVACLGGIAYFDTSWHKLCDFPVRIYSFYIYSDTLYFVSPNGLWKYIDGNFSQLLDYFCYSITSDENIWLGTNNGIVKFTKSGEGKRFIPKTPFDNYFRSIAIKDGNIFCAHGGCGHIPFYQISVLTQNGWEIYNENNEWNIGLEYSCFFSCLFTSSKNELWAGLWDGGNRCGVVKILSKDSVIQFKFVTGGAFPNVINTICEDKEGNIWVGSYGSDYIHRIRNDIVDSSFTASKEWIDRPLYLYVDKNNNLLLGHCNGLTVFSKDGYFKISGIPNATEVYSITEDKDGNIWASTSNGLYKIKDYKVISFYDILELGGKPYSCIVDQVGNLWLGVNGVGLKELTKDGKWSTFKVGDGLVSNEINEIKIDNDGTLWIATANGLSSYNPGILPPKEIKANVFPNPFILSTDRIINFHFNVSEGTLFIYTLSGKLVKKINFNKTNISIQNNIFNDSGIYIFVVKSKRLSTYGKFCVIK